MSSSSVQPSQSFQPDSELEKHEYKIGNGRKGLNIVLISVAVALVLILGLRAYLLGSKKTNLVQQTSVETNIQNKESENTTVDTPSTVDLTPQKNSIYLGTYLNRKALFLTDETKQRYYENGESKTSPYIGALTLDDTSGISQFDYQKLENPKKIIANSVESIININNFIFSNNQDIVYVSLNYAKEGHPYPNALNRILQISMDDNSTKEIWSNDIGSEKYANGKGPVYLEQAIGNRYVIFNILSCYACEGSLIGTVVLNISTKAERYYQMIGNVKIDLDTNLISYKKLEPFQEPCEPSPGCNDGQRTIMKPAGQVFTDTLP